MQPWKIEVTRNGLLESAHAVHVAVAGPDGDVRVRAGDVETPVFTRSAIKPFQALPLVEDGLLERWGLGGRELALCCASHSGEPDHAELAASMLERLGLGEDHLACGPHPPFHEPSAAALRERGEAPRRVHNNCSGKHAGMLALALGNEWPIEGYHETGHPVQERVGQVLGRWTGRDPGTMHRGVDGCGVVTFAIPLSALALGYARLAAAETGSAGARVLDAMGSSPRLIAGTGRLCTALAEATEGRVIAKVGAEGVYAAALRGSRIGVALKVEDGARRAAEVALLAVLDELGGLSASEREALSAWSAPAVHNTRGERVGRIRARASGAVGPTESDGAEHSGSDARSVLTPRTRALVRLSAALTRGHRVWPQYMDVAAELAPDEAEEVMLQSYLFMGYPVALNSLGLWRRRTGRESPPPVSWEPGAWQERGEAVCRRVYDHQYEALREVMAGIHPDLDRWAVTEGYGKVLGRSGLDLKTRELCVAGLLTGLDASRQLHAHLRGCLNVGATVAEVEAMLAAVGDVVGSPRLVAASAVWARVRDRWLA